ncbi:MAG: flagellar protein FliS [Lachnospiraceae bacterium]|nr:flagellar protein FliS [Lachnospiraceae bacterium]
MTNETIQYYTRKIADSNPTEIIVLVYEIAENYLDDAILAAKEEDFDTFDISIDKATKCINDLVEALDLQYEIGYQLMSIYMFMNKELSLSKIRRDRETVARIQAMLTKLKESFKELAKQDTSGAAMGNAQEVYAGLTYGRDSLNESTSIDGNRGFTV